MTGLDLEALVQDLRAHAPEAPQPCAALMRRAAAELERCSVFGLIPRAGSVPPHKQVKGASPCR